jgi:alkanesulfonate monooxygenase SsuD/methylene tetrahydromethanopterin reductase-like flavin-dependent oxidoreductase (luciferase family)
LGLVTLASQLNVDLSPFPLSATLAQIARSPSIHPAAAEKLLMQGPDTTLEELGRIFASSVRVPQLVGTGAQVADQLAELFTQGGCDGFVISPAYLPGSFSEFVESVIPHLQRKGLFRTAYEGSTLREHLGLGALAD